MALAGRLEIQMYADIARLKTDMAAMKGTVNQAMDQVSAAVGKAQSLFSKFGVTLSVGYFTHLIKGSIDAMDTLKDLSKSTSMSVDDLAALQLVAKQSGSELEGTAAAINKLSQNIGKDPQKFKALGISAKEPIEAFKQLADIFVALEDPQQRAAVMAAALGKSWQGAAPLLAEGSAGIDKLLTEARKYTGGMGAASEEADKFNDKLALMSGSAGVLAKVTAPLLPLLNSLADSTLAVMQEAAKSEVSFNPFLEALKTVVVVGGNVSFVFKAIGRDIGAAAAIMDAFTSGKIKVAMGLRAERMAEQEQDRKEFDAWEASIMAIGTAARKASVEVKALSAEEQAAANAAAAAKAKLAKETAARAAAFLNEQNEVKKVEAAYLSLLRSLEDMTGAMEDENAGREKMTEADKKALDAIRKLNDGTIKFTDAQKAALRVAIDALLTSDATRKMRERERAGLDAYVKTLEDGLDLEKEVNEILAAIAKKKADAILATEDLVKQIDLETKWLALSNDERARAMALQSALTAGVTKEEDVLRRLNDALRRQAEERAKLDFTRQLEQMQFEISLIGLSNVERDKATISRAMEASSMNKQSEAYDDLQKKIREAIDTRELRTTLVGLRDDLTSTMISAFESGGIRGAVRALIDWIKQQFAKLVLRPILEPIMGNVASMVLSLFGMGGGAASGVAGIAGAASGGGLGNLGTLMSLGSGAYNYGSQALAWLTSGAGANGAGALVSVNGVLQPISIGTAGGAGATSLAGAGAAGLLGAAAGYFLTPYLSKDEDAANNGAIGGGLGAVVGYYVGAGSVGGPWGAVIGAVVGILVAAFTDADGPAVRVATIAAGQIMDAYTYSMESELGSLGILRGSDQWFSDSEMGETLTGWFQAIKDIDNAVAARLTSAQLIAARASVSGGSAVMGFGVEHQDIDPAAFGRMVQDRYGKIFGAIDSSMGALITGFSGTTGDLLKLVDDLATVNYQLNTNGAELARVFGQSITFADIQAFKTEGETYSETLQRLGAVFFSTNAIAVMLGKTQEEVWGTIGLSSEAARQSLIEAAGGLDNFTSRLNSYYQHYFTEEERLQHSHEQLAESFAAIGLEMPTTLDGFRAYIEAQDLTTEAGRATYTALMLLESQFYSFITATTNTGEAVTKLAKEQSEAELEMARAAKDAAQTKLDMQKELYDLQHSEAEILVYNRALKMEELALEERRAGLAPGTLRDIQALIDKQIDLNAANRDAAAAAEEATRAEQARADELRTWQEKLDILNGTRTRQQIDREKLLADASSEATRELMRQVFAMEDAASAATVATAAFSVLAVGIENSVGGVFNPGQGLPGQIWISTGGNFGYWAYPPGYVAPGSGGGGGDVTSQRLSLLAEIYKLTGDAAGAAAVLEQQHAIALAALDPSLRDLQTQLWGLQAAAAEAAKVAELAAKQRKLDIELQRALGNEDLALAMERADILAALDASLRGTQQAIWDALDARQLEEATDNWTRSLQDWLRGSLLNDTTSPLTGRERLAAAMKQYSDDLLLAQAGDEDARSRYTSSADALLREALGMYGRGTMDYQAIWRMIQDNTSGLISAGGLAAPATISDVNSTLMATQQDAKDQADALIAEIQSLNSRIDSLSRQQQDESSKEDRRTDAIVGALDRTSDKTVRGIVAGSGKGVLA